MAGQEVEVSSGRSAVAGQQWQDRKSRSAMAGQEVEVSSGWSGSRGQQWQVDSDLVPQVEDGGPEPQFGESLQMNCLQAKDF